MALFKPENVEDFYEMGEILGSGHFGQVRRVYERTTRTQYAAKFLKVWKNVRSLHGVDRAQVEREGVLPWPPGGVSWVPTFFLTVYNPDMSRVF
uniref:Protein kinase domain-containing protein n=1 Tax=Neogobius melanostomus TaxID=47308 RepID=A0A8C6UNJ8_9GOBI